MGKIDREIVNGIKEFVLVYFDKNTPDNLAFHTIEHTKLVVKAAEKIGKEINRAREHLRQEVVVLAIAGAEKVLKREVDKKTHASALDELAAQL